jgi:hypothetical protein
VLLPDGQVLVAGGVASEPDFLGVARPIDGSGNAATQVYDPVSNVWQTSGPPARRHASFAGIAVLLGNGTVLLASEAGSAELYRSVLPRTKTDFNGDGKSDIVFEKGDGTRWLANMDGVTVQSAMALPGAAPGWVLAGMGDFDGNGTTDLLWRNSADPTQYWIYLMNGPTIIGGGPVTVAAGYQPTHIADFDGDLKADILWENRTGERWFSFMDGATVASFAAVPDAAEGWEIAGVGDFNGDHRADLLWVNTATPTEYWIYLMDGAAVIGNGGVGVAEGYRPTWIGDMNRDGKADIIWENAAKIELFHIDSRWVSMMDGAALRTSFSLPQALPYWTLVGVGDYDNAGGLDLLWQGDATQYWITLLSATATVIGNGGLTVAPGYVPLSQ